MKRLFHGLIIDMDMPCRAYSKGGKYMYKNLQILMINNNITEDDIARELNITTKAIKHRLTGNTDFKRSEMLVIKKKLFPNYTLDQIFDDEIKIIEN